VCRHHCPGTSITTTAPSRLAGASPGEVLRLPRGAQHGLAERRGLSLQPAGERALPPAAHTTKSRSWRCTGCPAHSTPYKPSSGTAWTSSSKTPCPPRRLRKAFTKNSQMARADRAQRIGRTRKANVLSSACHVPGLLDTQRWLYTGFVYPWIVQV